MDRLRSRPDELRFERFCGTAMAGLIAQLSIDIVVGVASTQSWQELSAPPTALDCRQGDTQKIDGRRYFKREGAAGLRTHQFSVGVHEGRFGHDHWRCRRTVYSDVASVQANEEPAQSRARRFTANRIAYSAAKDDFAAALLARH